PIGIYCLSLHDALPIYWELAESAGSADGAVWVGAGADGDAGAGLWRDCGCPCAVEDNGVRGAALCTLLPGAGVSGARVEGSGDGDRKSTRLNSSHQIIS